MVLLVVWIALVVVAAVVLGGLLFSLRGAQQRLQREVAGLQQDLAPTLGGGGGQPGTCCGSGTGPAGARGVTSRSTATTRRIR